MGRLDTDSEDLQVVLALSSFGECVNDMPLRAMFLTFKSLQGPE